MMIRFPRSFDGGVVNEEIVTVMDVMPTVLDLCDMRGSTGIEFDGVPITPMITHGTPSQHGGLNWAWRDRWAVRERDWKLIGVGDEPRELVNLAEDEPERENHLKDQPLIVKRLLERHRAWLADVSPKSSRPRGDN
jgi:arylsulfatase A-like enzyme